MEASSLAAQTGWNQREALLTGKRDEARLELKANKSTRHTCICCVSPQQPCTLPHAHRHTTRKETRGTALPRAANMIP